MFKKVMRRNNKSFLKKENTLDYYISNDSKFFDKYNGKENASESKKHEFLKKNLKATKVIPNQLRKKRSLPDNLGYFESRFGTISVGCKKYKKNSGIAFSLVPETVKDTSGIPERSLKSPKTYFGGEQKSRHKNFKASSLSFEYDPRVKEVKKLEQDHDGIVDEEEKLLYQDKKEDDKLERLESLKSKKGFKKIKIDKEIAKIKDIKKEKNEDNLALLKQINNFVDSMKKGKLKKTVESDDVVSRRKRIIELSGDKGIDMMSFEELINFLKEFMKKEDYQKLPEKLSEKDLQKLSFAQAKSLAKKILGKNFFTKLD